MCSMSLVIQACSARIYIPLAGNSGRFGKEREKFRRSD